MHFSKWGLGTYPVSIYSVYSQTLSGGPQTCALFYDEYLVLETRLDPVNSLIYSKLETGMLLIPKS